MVPVLGRLAGGDEADETRPCTIWTNGHPAEARYNDLGRSFVDIDLQRT